MVQPPVASLGTIDELRRKSGDLARRSNDPLDRSISVAVDAIAAVFEPDYDGRAERALEKLSWERGIALNSESAGGISTRSITFGLVESLHYVLREVVAMRPAGVEQRVARQPESFEQRRPSIDQRMSAHRTSSKLDRNQIFDQTRSSALPHSGQRMCSILDRNQISAQHRPLPGLPPSRWSSTSMHDRNTVDNQMFDQRRRSSDLSQSGWSSTSIADRNQMFDQRRRLSDLSQSGWSSTSMRDRNTIFDQTRRSAGLPQLGWSPTSIADRNQMSTQPRPLAVLLPPSGWSSERNTVGNQISVIEVSDDEEVQQPRATDGIARDEISARAVNVSSVIEVSDDDGEVQNPRGMDRSGLDEISTIANGVIVDGDIEGMQNPPGTDGMGLDERWPLDELKDEKILDACMLDPFGNVVGSSLDEVKDEEILEPVPLPSPQVGLVGNRSGRHGEISTLGEAKDEEIRMRNLVEEAKLLWVIPSSVAPEATSKPSETQAPKSSPIAPSSDATKDAPLEIQISTQDGGATGSRDGHSLVPTPLPAARSDATEDTPKPSENQVRPPPCTLAAALEDLRKWTEAHPVGVKNEDEIEEAPVAALEEALFGAKDMPPILRPEMLDEMDDPHEISFDSDLELEWKEEIRREAAARKEPVVKPSKRSLKRPVKYGIDDDDEDAMTDGMLDDEPLRQAGDSQDEDFRPAMKKRKKTHGTKMKSNRVKVINPAKKKRDASQPKRYRMASTGPASCLFCACRPATVTAYMSHLHGSHSTTLKKSGIYLACSCGIKATYQWNAPYSRAHREKCGGRDFTVEKLAGGEEEDEKRADEEDEAPPPPSDLPHPPSGLPHSADL